MGCRHEHLHTGSGDYYVLCIDCGAVWARMNGRQPEYGQDATGNTIGADPGACTPGFVMDGSVWVKSAR